MSDNADNNPRAAGAPVSLRMLGYELAGVLTDIQHGGFDDVCRETLERVRAQLHGAGHNTACLACLEQEAKALAKPPVFDVQDADLSLLLNLAIELVSSAATQETWANFQAALKVVADRLGAAIPNEAANPVSVLDTLHAGVLHARALSGQPARHIAEPASELLLLSAAFAVENPACFGAARRAEIVAQLRQAAYGISVTASPTV